jgi:probable rRNA maturation factor
MILIEPEIEEKFGSASFKKRRLASLLSAAREAVPLSGSVSVMLMGDRQIRRLNREFRRKDKATDVLSFPAAEVGGRQRIAGDLAISVETAAREAEARGHALVLELEILLLHGVLHLAGYDHETDSGQMARKEEKLRRQLGLSQGLIARTTESPRKAPRASKTAAKRSPRR